MVFVNLLCDTVGGLSCGRTTWVSTAPFPEHHLLKSWSRLQSQAYTYDLIAEVYGNEMTSGLNVQSSEVLKSCLIHLVTGFEC